MCSTQSSVIRYNGSSERMLNVIASVRRMWSKEGWVQRSHQLDIATSLRWAPQVSWSNRNNGNYAADFQISYLAKAIFMVTFREKRVLSTNVTIETNWEMQGKPHDRPDGTEYQMLLNFWVTEDRLVLFDFQWKQEKKKSGIESSNEQLTEYKNLNRGMFWWGQKIERWNVFK